MNYTLEESSVPEIGNYIRLRRIDNIVTINKQFH
jgi:hypothetical protein